MEVSQRRDSDAMSSRSLSIVLVNDRKEIPRLADIAQRFGEVHHLSEDDTLNIQLVLDEIVINAIIHGYEEAGDHNQHEIHVRLALDEQLLLTIEVEDDARPYDPREAPEPQFDLPIEERRIGGLGVHIVKALMDTIDYRRENNHNILTMTKQLEAVS